MSQEWVTVSVNTIVIVQRTTWDQGRTTWDAGQTRWDSLTSGFRPTAWTVQTGTTP